jgi:hypothetical protein
MPAVYVENMIAVSPYEKLDFKKTDRYSTLIWREREE